MSENKEEFKVKLNDKMDKYYQNYKLKDVKMREERANKHKYIYGF